MSLPSPSRVTELIGIYDATWDFRGAIEHLKNLATQSEDCALCQITHSSIAPKAEWKQLVAELGVPFPVLGLNQLNPEIEVARAGRAPLVLVRTSDKLRILLQPGQIGAASGDVDTFRTILTDALAAEELEVPVVG